MADFTQTESHRLSQSFQIFLIFVWILNLGLTGIVWYRQKVIQTSKAKVITTFWKKKNTGNKHRHSALSHIAHNHHLYQCVLLHFLEVFSTSPSFAHKHSITSCIEWSSYMCLRLYRPIEGIITAFILWPSVWFSQRASFSWATVGHSLAGLWNIWILWLAASPLEPPISTLWQTGTQTGATHANRQRHMDTSSAPAVHAVLPCRPCLCLCVQRGGGGYYS